MQVDAFKPGIGATTVLAVSAESQVLALTPGGCIEIQNNGDTVVVFVEQARFCLINPRLSACMRAVQSSPTSVPARGRPLPT